MARLIIAAFLLAHGLAHVLGFLGAWQLGRFEDAPYTTSILNGLGDVGDVGIRVVGLLWIVAAAAFVAAAGLVARRSAAAPRSIVAAAVLSLGVCMIGLPAAAIGLGIDVAILAGIVLLRMVRSAALPALAR